MWAASEAHGEDSRKLFAAGAWEDGLEPHSVPTRTEPRPPSETGGRNHYRRWQSLVRAIPPAQDLALSQARRYVAGTSLEEASRQYGG